MHAMQPSCTRVGRHHDTHAYVTFESLKASYVPLVPAAWCVVLMLCWDDGLTRQLIVTPAAT